MKKNIASRIVRKNQLAAAAIAVILAMFPWGAENSVLGQVELNGTQYINLEDLRKNGTLASSNTVELLSDDASLTGKLDISPSVDIEITGGEQVRTISGKNKTFSFINDTGGTAKTLMLDSLHFMNFNRAVSLNGGVLDIDKTYFSNNSVAGIGANGGAVRAEGTLLTVKGAVFTGNEAGGSGGAVYVEDELLTVEESAFTGNHAGANGGAVYVKDELLAGTLMEIGGTEFTGNSAVANGGAVYVEDTLLTVEDAVFTGNSSGANGGAVDILITGKSLPIPTGTTACFTDTSFTNNTAAGKGGAIAMENKTGDAALLVIEAKNSDIKFTGNSAGSGKSGQDIYLSGVAVQFHANEGRTITIGSGLDSNGRVDKTGKGTLQIYADSTIGKGGNENMLTVKEGKLYIGNGAVVSVAGNTVMEAGATLSVDLNDRYAANIPDGNQAAIYTDEFRIISPVTISLTGYTGGKPEVQCNQEYPGSGGVLYTLVNSKEDIDKSEYTVDIQGAADISALTDKNFLWYQEVKNDENKSKIQIGAGLVWNNIGTNDHHGTFYVPDGCPDPGCSPYDNCGEIVSGKVFTLNTNLKNNTSGNGYGGWDGNTLTKTGGGTLVLGGDDTGIGENTYTGGTEVKDGWLVATHQNASGVIDSIGSGAVVVGAGATFQVGAYGISCSSEGTKSLTSNAALDSANTISGAGNFAVSAGNGTLTVGFANTYTGDTTVHSGTLKLTNLNGTGENTAGTETQVQIKGNAILDLAAGGTYNKQVAGDGTLVKSTGDLVTLTGENDHAATVLQKGQTDISDNKGFGRGTVKMEKGTTAGFNPEVDKVANDFFLNGNASMQTKDAAQTVLLSGEIRGQNKLTKTGKGTIELTGNNELFSGGLDINEGRVKVHSQSKTALGEGPVVNNSELELHLDAAETLDVNKIDSTKGKFIKSGSGNLIVDKVFTTKQYEQKSGNLTIVLDKAHITATDGFVFGGDDTTLTGKVVNSAGLARGEDNGKSYLAFDGAGSSFFSRQNSNALFDTGTLKHIEWSTYQDGNKLYYKLWAVAYSEAYGSQLSDNGLEAAKGVDSIPLDDPINEALNRLGTADDIVKAFAELHGEIYKTAIYAEADMQRNFNETILRRGLLCEECYSFKGFRGQSKNEVGRRELWATFTGGGNFRSNISRYSGYNAGRWGVVAGLEQMFARGWFIGGAFGYDKADLSLSNLPSKDSFYAARFSGYLNYTYGQMSTVGFIGYAKNWHDIDRNITFMNLKSNSKFNDDICTFGAETRYLIHVNTIDFIPTAGFTVVDVDAPYIEETGAGAASLRLRRDGYSSFRVPVGFRANSLFDVQDITLRPEIRMFYISEWGDGKIRGVSSFAADSSKTFMVGSGISGHCGFRLGAGVEAKVFDRLLLGFDYDAEIWNRYSRHDVGGHLTVRW